MAEPVDPGADALAVVGAFNAVQVKAYDPATDEHADGVDCPGVRGPRRVEAVAVGDGETRVTRATWYLAAAEIGGRPVLKSLIVDGAEEWVIDSIAPDAMDSVIACETTLSG